MLARLTSLMVGAAIAGIFASACTAEDLPPVRNHSFAQPASVVMTHLDLDLTVDFDKERMSGHAVVHFDNKTGADVLYLDTRSLDIDRVTWGPASGEETNFATGPDAGYLGQFLEIEIPSEAKFVTIYYTTTPEGAVAVDWLGPEQTLGGRMPFLFTQGQPILNRSWIPFQDTPEVRFTYNATIRVPEGMMAIMSAANGTEKTADGVYKFEMPQPIPGYLIALAIGDIEFRAISERCGVYAEPELVEAAAWEFDDTERMMQIAEEMYGPYRWDRFDVIVLPPSFPYGGMENPRLTFLTPVLVAGDRSLVSTIAHELAHSWSGNLVTNASWNDFWLNEGFTTYFERRIQEAVFGRERSEMESVLGYQDLVGGLDEVGWDNPDSRLRIEVDERDPDDAWSGAAYEKGYLLLRLIEETVGRDAFDAFLLGYFDAFAFETMTTDKFLFYLDAELWAKHPGAKEKVDIMAWVDGTGLPDNHPVASTDAFLLVEKEIERFVAGATAEQLATDGWNSLQWKHFVRNLPRGLTHEQMADLEAAFEFTYKANGEVTQQWLLHVIDSRYEPAYPRLEAFLVEIGRIWLIRPLYQQLATTDDGKEMAVTIYEKARPGYHPLTVVVVDRILQADGQGSR